MPKYVVALGALTAALATPAAHCQTAQTQIFSGAAGPSKCLGVKDNDLTHPFMAKCAGYTAENWTVGPPDKHGFVRFRSQKTGSDVCLGVIEADTSTVKMAPCAGVKNQQWVLTPTGKADTYTVTSQLLGPGICLGIRAKTDNSELDMNTCHGYPGQNWTIHL